jgi:hypothetical protein
MKELIRKILNEETNKGKYISAIEDLTEDFKNEDCVCDIKIEYKPEEEIYLINVILGNGDMDDKFKGINWRERDYRGKLKTKIRKEVFGYLPIPFFVEFKQTPRCKDYKNLQESEDKKGKYINALEDLTEGFKNEDCVCDIQVEHTPEEFRDLYLINVVLGIREINSKFKGSNHQLRRYLQQLKRKIADGIFDFLPIPFFVNFSETPNCSDYRNLQESEDKKPRFLSTIEQDGLFQVMQDTGLSLPQIYTKTGELPREVLERYVKDFIKNDGDQLTSGSDADIGLMLGIEISAKKEIESFYLSKGVVMVEVNEFDSNGRRVAGSYERLSNLSDEEIFIIVDELSQLSDDYFNYM